MYVTKAAALANYLRRLKEGWMADTGRRVSLYMGLEESHGKE
jgi:hypothetical protein